MNTLLLINVKRFRKTKIDIPINSVLGTRS